MQHDDVTKAFLEFSRHKLIEEYSPRLRAAVECLTDEQVWWRPNEASNSVGNLLLHLNGNVRQWLVGTFTRGEDARDRPAEFAERQLIPASRLLDMLDRTLQEVAAVLSRVSEQELLATYRIQGYTASGLAVVYHVVEHFGMHYGQILYVAKLLHGADLGFYKELDRTGRLGD
ncbi:MAG: DinB family protein [Acidobacteriota bacterium]